MWRRREKGKAVQYAGRCFSFVRVLTRSSSSRLCFFFQWLRIEIGTQLLDPSIFNPEEVEDRHPHLATSIRSKSRRPERAHTVAIDHMAFDLGLAHRNLR